MDPIEPIVPSPPAISRVKPLPVERLERVRRDRDRPARDGGRRRRPAPEDESFGRPEGEAGGGHVDVRA